MTGENSGRQELEQCARALVDQADRLIRLLGVDVSGAETFSRYSPAFRQTANAYERLVLTEKGTNRVAWERKVVDGRNGAEIMDRLWKVREALRWQDQSSGRA